MGTIKVRNIMKPFGSSGGSGEFGKVGSKAAGSPVTTKDLTLIQDLTEYDQGYFAITSDQGTSRLPYSEDLNSLFFLSTSQLAYLFEAGVPEWLDSADQEYFINQGFVSKNGSLYVCIKGDGTTDINVQKDPETNPLWWRILYTSSPVSAYDIAEAVTYETAGILVERYGEHYSSTGLAGNSGKDPANPVNVDYWYPSDGPDLLEKWAKKGKVVPGGMHDINDRAGAQYAQDLLIDQIKKGATTFNLTKVSLDGTTVTGDTNLEDDILKVGTINEYPYLDIYAPDILGTRTLLEMGGHVVESMTSGGGVDVMGFVHEDYMQRITGHAEAPRLLQGSVVLDNFTGSLSRGVSASIVGAGSDSTPTITQAIDFDSSNSLLPNAAKTNPDRTAHAALVEGIASIIVMHT